LGKTQADIVAKILCNSIVKFYAKIFIETEYKINIFKNLGASDAQLE
jgi:hypothetical protein